MADWICVKDRLPKRQKRWESYIVVVNRSHYPTSSYDPCDAPYDEEIVTTAKYDSEQKIWHQWTLTTPRSMEILSLIGCLCLNHRRRVPIDIR